MSANDLPEPVADVTPHEGRFPWQGPGLTTNKTTHHPYPFAEIRHTNFSKLKRQMLLCSCPFFVEEPQDDVVALNNSLARDVKGVIRATNSALATEQKEKVTAELLSEPLDRVFSALLRRLEELDAQVPRDALFEAVARAIDIEDWLDIRFAVVARTDSNLAAVIRRFAAVAFLDAVRPAFAVLSEAPALDFVLPSACTYEGLQYTQFANAYKLTHEHCPTIKAKIKIFVTICSVAETRIASFAQAPAEYP